MTDSAFDVDSVDTSHHRSQETDMDHDRLLALAREHADLVSRIDSSDAAAAADLTRRRLEIEALLDATVDGAAEARAKTAALEATDFELRIADLVLPPSTVVVRWSDGSGVCAELTDDEVSRVFDALKSVLGLEQLTDLPLNNADLPLDVCIRDGEHGHSIEPDGTCTYCGTRPR